MDSLEFISEGCGTLQEAQPGKEDCPSDEVKRHWRFPPAPGGDMYTPTDIERLNRICDDCDKYTPLKG